MEKKTNKRQKIIRISGFVAYCIIMLLIFRVTDFVEAVASAQDDYEIRYEEPIGVNNSQKVYRLYKNDQYMNDIDYNLYSLLDANGNMDLKYCVLMVEAKNLSYALILGTMMVIVAQIVSSISAGTPFTRRNANYIRVIGILQFALAIVPGLVSFIMQFVKFEYVNITLEWTGVHMFIIAFAILVLAQVFDYGVKLQEDVDSIA